ncbi:MAG: isochorismatase family protein [Actinophytocola sp.]|nr:isochorismatase family protein [Actinophytocola sp.]
MTAQERTPWDRFLTTEDVAVFAASGYGQRRELTTPMALLVVDVTYAFTGDPGLSLLASIERYPNSCGPAAWAAVEVIQAVLPAVRERGIPVIYTTGASEHDWLMRRSWGEKHARTPIDAVDPAKANEIVEPIRTGPQDVVIAKTKPSAFFDTPLRQYLVGHGIRQLAVCGGSTSGCVRATVVDGFSHGYRVAVLAEATFDRGEASHAISLFDMQQKYADLISTDELLAAVTEG